MAATGREEGQFCALTLEAEPYRLSLVRHAVSVWLRTVGWPERASSQIVFAVSEAVSNTVEHAYTSDPPGLVWIALSVEHADADHDRVRAVIQDRGRWRAGDPEPGRGNGIPLMQALCTAVDVVGGADGTRVTLLSEGVAAASPR